MTEYTQHPLSAAFPAMPDAEYTALVDDIRDFGLRDPVSLYQGQIIDGWHRYRACLDAGREPRFTQCDAEGEDGDPFDPIAFVIGRNLRRRHLSASQRAAAVVACHSWKTQSDNQRRIDAPAPVPGQPASNAQMAAEAETGERTIRQAKRADEAGLGAAVLAGKISAKKAAAQAVGKTATVKKPTKRERELAAKLKSETERADALEDAAEEASALASENEALKALNGGDEETAALIKKYQNDIAQLERDAAYYKKERDRLITENADLRKKLAHALRRAA